MSGKLYEFSTFRIGIASLLFCCANILQVYSLAVLSPTMYQMLLSCVVIFTPLISRVALNKRLYKHTIVGIICTVIALCSICLSSLVLDITTHDRKDAQGWDLVIAIAMMATGLFICSIQRVYEEWLLSRIETSTFRFVGLEGLYGVIFLTFAHLIFFGIGKIKDGFIFDAGAATEQIINSWPLLITSILLLISTTFHDMCGIVVTRKVSATYRVVNDLSRTIVIWIVEILLYDLQNDIDNLYLYIIVSIWRLISYLLLIFGNILINELVDIRICGLDKYFGRYNENKLDDSVVSESDEFSIMKS